MLEPAPLLEIDDLRVYFKTDEGVARAVDGVGLRVDSGRCLGVVGESGCGKSVMGLSILGLVPAPPGFVAGGAVRFRGRDLLSLPNREMRRVRGREIAMVFQEPMTSLNPVLNIGDQIVEAVLAHQRRLRRREAWEMACEALASVGMASPEIRMASYPHHLSGGMKQRVMIAMALVARPALLIADEPTTALDVTIQAQILELLERLRAEMGLGVMLITHDLAVVAENTDDVVVMYAGKLAECAPTSRLFDNPVHPYTRGLLASIPPLDGSPGRLEAIPGMVPRPHEFPSGCRFKNRCRWAEAICDEEPVLAPIEEGHLVACHLVARPALTRRDAGQNRPCDTGAI